MQRRLPESVGGSPFGLQTAGWLRGGIDAESAAAVKRNGDAIRALATGGDLGRALAEPSLLAQVLKEPGRFRFQQKPGMRSILRDATFKRQP